jgi:hypothetical protein
MTPGDVSLLRTAVARRDPQQQSQEANLDALLHPRKVWLGTKHRQRRPCVGRHPDANAQSAARLPGWRLRAWRLRFHHGRHGGRGIGHWSRQSGGAAAAYPLLP